ncbi:3-ketoacyl- thiolase 2, peroxisomal [Olea europaea subsp. europaea]|uniref:3-ketoacyl- thiolase 2, peroxisomal n=1 Tax=Olea europaea subsp. europaea TaxID=158383 RepID=A0A8S0U865_OLEEU|nr:3-ketoacyl- thiolase 2, peroxisomal [Olea europaea subsp. europaea]
MEQARNCLLPMGITSENVAHHFGVSRQEQDQAAVESRRKAAFATASGKFKEEIVPVKTKCLLFSDDRTALQELNEKWGSSEDSISKIIEKEYKNLPWAHLTLLKHHLEKLCESGEVVTRGRRYMLSGAIPNLISSTRHKRKKRKKKWKLNWDWKRER